MTCIVGGKILLVNAYKILILMMKVYRGKTNKILINGLVKFLCLVLTVVGMTLT